MATAAATARTTTRPSRALPHVRDDAALVAGLRRQDPAAVEQLFSAYGRQIAHWARSSGQEADDIVQDVMLRVWRSGPRLEPDTDLPAWLKTVTMNTVRNRWRTASRKPQVPVGLEPNVVDVTDPYDRRTERIALEQALEALQPRERDCLKMLYLSDMPLQDVAERLGSSKEATKSLAARARRRIRSEITKTAATGGVAAILPAFARAAEAMGAGAAAKIATATVAVLTAGALTLAATGDAPSPAPTPARGPTAPLTASIPSQADEPTATAPVAPEGTEGIDAPLPEAGPGSHPSTDARTRRAGAAAQDPSSPSAAVDHGLGEDPGNASERRERAHPCDTEDPGETVSPSPTVTANPRGQRPDVDERGHQPCAAGARSGTVPTVLL